jgi:hypothetical protein
VRLTHSSDKLNGMNWDSSGTSSDRTSKRRKESTMKPLSTPLNTLPSMVSNSTDPLLNTMLLWPSNSILMKKFREKPTRSMCQFLMNRRPKSSKPWSSTEETGLKCKTWWSLSINNGKHSETDSERPSMISNWRPRQL